MEKVHSFSTKDQNIFFTSDTHFWHTNIIKYAKRPFGHIEEMNNTIIASWNKVVGKNDIVFHLGDFCFCGSDKLKTLLDSLNGKIYLIMGNHDWKTIKDGQRKRFAGVYQQMSIRVDGQPIYLNHFPFLCFAGSYRGDRSTWQLFGHVHSGIRNREGLDNDRLQYLFPTQYDVGVDNNNFKPVSFQEVEKIIENQIANA
ncbi:MAG: metallophosphoesterase [Clostridia bacterium]|nr:metallophosphoesterase [Clostridia bacterium]